MRSGYFIKKIKNYSVIAFILPLITINSCLLFYKLLGSIEVYEDNADLDWNLKKVEKPYEPFKTYPSSLVNCPKYKLIHHYVVTVDNKTFDIISAGATGLTTIDNLTYQKALLDFVKKNKIKSEIYEFGKTLNPQCIKNSKFLYILLSNFKFLENILLDALDKNSSGFSKIKNPYMYGEVSISRTARYYPATLIFKPFIILSSIFLILYWRNNLNLFNELKNKNVFENFSKNFYYLGILSCIFLILHASLLGLDYDSKLFNRIRKVIIILFIFFEILAQASLTNTLFKLKESLNNYTKIIIIKIKVIFVSVIFVLTLILFTLFALVDLSSDIKHILEWNYFSILLFYYFLSRLLWK